MKIKEQSTWESLNKKQIYPELKNNLEADVVIVGGGMAGLLTAYQLSKTNKNIVLLEKETLAASTTSYTTAFLEQSIDLALVEIEDLYDKKTAKLVWQSHKEAIDFLEDTAKKERIDCEFIRCSAYEFAQEEQDLKDLKEEYELSKEFGFKTTFNKSGDLAIGAKGYMEIKNQGLFHPIKFINGLIPKIEKNGVSFFEKTEATEIKELDNGKLKVVTKNSTIITDKVIVTTYQPFANPKELLLKKGMYKSYVYELKIPKGTLKIGQYLDQENPYHYFRIDPQDGFDRVIIGGEDHRIELPGLEAKSFKALNEYVAKVFKDIDYTIVRRWSGPILEPSDGLALIGEYKPNQFVATAFSGSGMTYSAITAKLLTDLISGKKNEFSSIYDPKRTPTLKQLTKMGIGYVEEFIGGAGKNLFK